MAKYRKKPVVVEAIQWDGTNLKQIKEFAGKCVKYEKVTGGGHLLTITTLETEKKVKTKHCATVGDWIVKGWSRERGYHCWPVKPDYFADNYEEVVE